MRKHFASGLVWLNIVGLVVLGGLMGLFATTDRAWGACLGMWIAAGVLMFTAAILWRIENFEATGNKRGKHAAPRPVFSVI